jgi:flagellar motor switch protein FliN/FliY
MMTQEEINKLMQSSGGGGSDTSDNSSATDVSVNDDEKDALGEIGNICMGTCATTLYTLLGKRVHITTPKVSIGNVEDYLKEYNKPFVAVEVSYTEGISGYNILLLKQEDVLLITDLLMGGEGNIDPNAELDELSFSAISEVMNQMVGSSSTALANMLGRTINISTPRVKKVIFDDEDLSQLICHKDITIKTSFTMEIEDVLVSEIMQIMPLQAGKELVNMLMNGELDDIAEVSEAAPAPQQAPAPVQTAPPVQPAPVTPRQEPQKSNMAESNMVGVKSVQYQSFDEAPRSSSPQRENENIDMIMDVPLQVTVELGSCKKSIKEILGFTVGSVVVLDRLAGEMVDVMVNGKLFAVGEVVVIDDSYGVRLTDIISPR